MKLLTASLYVNPNKHNVAFIGKVTGNSLKNIREKARQHARSWNKRGKIRVEIEETGREFIVNAY